MQRRCIKTPLCGIAVFKKIELLYSTNPLSAINTFFMKLLSDSIRSFFEGFVSFYTSFYDEMKKW